MSDAPGVVANGPVRLTVTMMELIALATLQDHTLPEVVQAWASDASADDGREARVEEALASLVVRNYVAVAGDEAYVTSSLAALLELLCEPDWAVEGVVVPPEGFAPVFQVSGSGQGGVLAEPVAPRAISLFYRPDARGHLAEAASAMELVHADAGLGPDGGGERVPLEALSETRDWEQRIAFGVSFSDLRSGSTSAVEWLRLGQRRYRLDVSAGRVFAAPVGDAQLRNLLIGAAEVIS